MTDEEIMAAVNTVSAPGDRSTVILVNPLIVPEAVARRYVEAVAMLYEALGESVEVVEPSVDTVEAIYVVRPKAEGAE
jgi:hypothetical protein